MPRIASLTDVSIKRGKTWVIKSLNLEIASGQVVGLLGPSGAGKTTILRALMAVQAKVEGQVSLFDVPAGQASLATRVSYDTQASSVFDDLTVKQNLDFMRIMLGKKKSTIARAVAAVNLEGFEKAKVRNLSGGQRSRVSLAMALIGDPEFLILDEPTVGLDPVLRSELWTIFKKLAAQGKTLIVSSHVMDEAERCDSLVFMRDGRVIANDTLANILKATNTHSAEEAFLALAMAPRENTATEPEGHHQ